MDIKKNYIKVIIIGESGSGKSTMIRHLAQNPEQLRSISSQTGSAGTTKCSVEYIFGDFPCITVESVDCNIKTLLSKDNYSYLQIINEAKIQISQKTTTFEDLTKKQLTDIATLVNERLLSFYNIQNPQTYLTDLNKPNLLNTIKINIPASQELLNTFPTNIETLHIVDTPGIGTKYTSTQNTSFSGADAMMLVTKTDNTTPDNIKQLNDIMKNYNYLPKILIERHSFDEESINLKNNANEYTPQDYLNLLDEYTKDANAALRSTYIKDLEISLTTPKQKKLKSCLINYLPSSKNMFISNVTSVYYKFYVPACIRIFKNCLSYIQDIQILENQVRQYIKERVQSFSKFSLLDIEELPNIIENVPPLFIHPRCKDPYRDLRYIINTKPNSKNTYYWNCAGYDIIQMLEVHFYNLRKNLKPDLREAIVFVMRCAIKDLSVSFEIYGANRFTIYKSHIVEIVELCRTYYFNNFSHPEPVPPLDNLYYNNEGVVYNNEHALIIILLENSLRFLLEHTDKFYNYNGITLK